MKTPFIRKQHEVHSSNSSNTGLITFVAIALLGVSFAFFMLSPLLPWGKHADLNARIADLENVVQMINGSRKRHHDMPPVIETFDTHAFINAAGIYINGQPMKFADLYDVQQTAVAEGPMLMWKENEIVSANVTTDQIPEGHLNKYLLAGSVNTTHLSGALTKGAANGIAPLDSNGHVPLAHLPLGTVSSVQVVPTWVERDALSVNTGDVAVVLNANGTGHRETYIWNSTAWVQLSDDLGVVSWNNQTGTVSVTTDQLPEGSTHQYFTPARVASHPDVATGLSHSLVTSGNPHGVTKAEVGLGNVANTKNDLAASTSPNAFLDVSSGFTPGSLVVVPAGAGSVWHATDTTIGLAKWKRMDGMLPPAQSSVVSDSIARFDGTTGLLVKDSAVTITASGNIVLNGLVDGRDVSVDGVTLDAHVGTAIIHRQIDDAGVATTTTLWSSAKTATELAIKAAVAHSHVASDVSDFSTAVGTLIAAQKGTASGLASLDTNGKVPAAQLDIAASTVFKGIWNADTNEPHLTDDPCGPGEYYITSVAGAISLGGISPWGVGDWIMCDSTAHWSRITSVSTVSSVAGKTGAITLEPADIASGSSTFADSLISQSSVTQHQTSLSITGSQIIANPSLSGYLELSDVIVPGNGAAGTGRLYKKQSNTGLYWKPDAAGLEVNLAAPAAGLTLLEVSSVVEAITTSIVYSPLPDITITPVAAGTYKVDFTATVYMDEAKDSKAYFAMFVGGVVVAHTKRQLFFPSGHKHAFYGTVAMSALVTVNGAQTIIVQYRCHASGNTLRVYERSMQLVK
jgi:hypothetical protein